MVSVGSQSCLENEQRGGFIHNQMPINPSCWTFNVISLTLLLMSQICCFSLYIISQFGHCFSVFLLFLLQINCVTFPLPGEGPEQQLLKPNEWSYCDYFWVSSAETQEVRYKDFLPYFDDDKCKLHIETR